MKTCAAAMAVALLALTIPLQAEPNVTGYNKLSVPANNDLLVSVPFSQPVKSFAVLAKTGTGFTVSDTLTAGAYNTVYFVRFTSGSADGRWATITSNTVNEFVLADVSFLADVSVGDTFTVFAHWTLGSIFPAALEGRTFLASASPVARSVEVLVPSTATGINKPAAATYYYYNGQWRKVGSSPVMSFTSTVITPDTYFILRNKSAQELLYMPSGTVATGALARTLQTATSANDVPASTGRPTPVTLKQLNLGGTAAFEASLSPVNRKDQLLVYTNATTGLNKPADATYYFYNNAWRKVGAAPTVSFDSQVLPAGAALIIRKAASTGAAVEWTQPSPF